MLQNIIIVIIILQNIIIIIIIIIHIIIIIICILCIVIYEFGENWKKMNEKKIWQKHTKKQAVYLRQWPRYGRAGALVPFPCVASACASATPKAPRWKCPPGVFGVLK